MIGEGDGTLVREPGVTVTLMGGLGNQLFMYGSGLAVARRLDCPLYLDLSWFDRQGLRTFEMSGFVHCGLVLSTGNRAPGRVRRAGRRIGKLARARQFHEGSFCFDPAILQVEPGTSLHGYFQSWKYLEPVVPELRAQVLDLAHPSAWFAETLQRLRELLPWTALHVRRGDYRNPETARMHGLAGADYYARALAVEERLVGARTLVVFSDEPDEARGILRSVARDKVFVETPAGSPPLESLVLMSLADSIVTANSSFSWWGAWLTDRPEKIVVAPRPWFAELAHDERDLLPPHWISVGI